MTKAPSASGFPPQIKSSVVNEARERFSFYGMRAVLTVFLEDDSAPAGR